MPSRERGGGAAGGDEADGGRGGEIVAVDGFEAGVAEPADVGGKRVDLPARGAPEQAQGVEHHGPWTVESLAGKRLEDGQGASWPERSEEAAEEPAVGIGVEAVADAPGEDEVVRRL